MRIGIDPGGTKIAAGLVGENRVLGLAVQGPTDLPKSARELVEVVYRLTERLLKERGLTFQDVGSAGIGTPGAVNKEADCAGYANDFGFGNVPFLKMLKDLFPCPVYGENDAKTAAWGEYLAGTGRRSRSMTAVTLGTGVGGGIILNGGILEGDNGTAGELDHVVIHRNGHSCTCGRRDCLEAYASVTALVSRAKEVMERSDKSMLWPSCKGDPSGVNGRITFEASEKGDSTVCEVLDGSIEDLSEGTANIINILQPGILCIGGGLSGAGEALLAPVKGETAPKICSRIFQKSTRIRLAEMGNGAGIIGTVYLNEQR